ncbi:MAG: DM13 domain-containing protein [Alphaproteobacteria bacterium]
MHRYRATSAAVAVIAVLAVGCTQSGDRSATQTIVLASHNVTGLETATGSFVGASGHETTGTASVFWTGSQWVVSLGSDFSLDGAPDPVVGLGNEGYDPAAKLGPLQSDTGAQVYPLPAGLDIGDYLQVHIWCEEFAVPLGVADLRLL